MYCYFWMLDTFGSFVSVVLRFFLDCTWDRYRFACSSRVHLRNQSHEKEEKHCNCFIQIIWCMLLHLSFTTGATTHLPKLWNTSPTQTTHIYTRVLKEQYYSGPPTSSGQGESINSLTPHHPIKKSGHSSEPCRSEADGDCAPIHL